MKFIENNYDGTVIERKAYRMEDGFKKVDIYLKTVTTI